MVFEITRFYCRPDKTSSSFLRQGAFHAILHDGFWKGDPDFIFMFHFQMTLIFILNGLDVIRLFVLAGISLLGAKCWGGGVWPKWLPKRQIEEQYLLLGHFLAPNCVFWAIVRDIISFRMAYAGGQENIIRQEGRKKRHKKCIFHVCVERLLAGGFQPNVDYVFVAQTSSNVQNFIVITWVVSELWDVEFPCCYREPRPSLTLC